MTRSDDDRVPAPGDAVAWAYRVEGISGTEKFCLVTLALYASLDEDGRWTAWPGSRTLGRNLGVSRDRARQVVRSLETAGWVARESRERDSGASSSNRYVLAVEASPGGAGSPGGGERAHPPGGERATTQCEPQQGTPTDEPPPDDPRTDRRLPQQIGRGNSRRRISKDLAALAVRIMDYWEARTGVKSNADVGRAIVLRLTEEIDATTEDVSQEDVAIAHKRLIDVNLAAPWWEGKAPPTVLYGNGRAYASAKARMSGQRARHHAQEPTRRRSAERDARRVEAAIEAAKDLDQ